MPLGDHPRHGPEPDGRGRWSGGRVLVLNATYEPINVCTVRRATVLLLKDKAEVIEIGSQTLHWANGSLAKPVVIRLITYVKIPRDTHKRKMARRAVFARDGWECQYCGARTSLTVDHVIPRSKGGTSGWTTSSRCARPATAVRATGCRTRSTCIRASSRGCRVLHLFIQLSSPTIPRPGSSTCCTKLRPSARAPRAGSWITAESQPRLIALIAEAGRAARRGLREPPAPGEFVELRRGRRALVLGLPLFAVLSEDEWRAVVSGGAPPGGVAEHAPAWEDYWLTRVAPALDAGRAPASPRGIPGEVACRRAAPRRSSWTGSPSSRRS